MANLKIGQRVHGSAVEASEAGGAGIFVQLLDNLCGFIPAHLCSKKAKDPNSRLDNDVLECRVWKVDHQMAILACRKKLLDVKLMPNVFWPDKEVQILKKPPNETQVGKVVPLVVLVAGLRDGLICKTFGDVRCWVPRENLKKQNPAERFLSNLYPSGTLFCARISQYIPQGENITTNNGLVVDACFVCWEIPSVTVSNLETRAQLRGPLRLVLTSKQDDVLQFRAEVDGQEIPVEITPPHLSDFYDVALAHFRFLSVGANMVKPRLWHFEEEGPSLFTAKKTLLELRKAQEDGHYPQVGDDLGHGRLVIGVIQKVTKNYIVVKTSFAEPHDEAYVRRANVSDDVLESVMDCGVGVRPGTTVVGKFIQYKTFKKTGDTWLELTLKPSIVCVDLDQAALRYMMEYFCAYDGFCGMAFPGIVEKRLCGLCDGSPELTATFLSSSSDEDAGFERLVKVNMDTERLGIEKVVVVTPPSSAHLLCGSTTEGSALRCCVVHFRLTDCTLVLLPSVVLRKAVKVVSPPDADGTQVARIVYKQPEFSILLTWDGRLVYATSKVHLCDVVDKSVAFRVDQQVPFFDCVVNNAGRVLCLNRVQVPLKTQPRNIAGLETVPKKGQKRRAPSEGPGDLHADTPADSTVAMPAKRRKKKKSLKPAARIIAGCDAAVEDEKDCREKKAVQGSSSDAAAEGDGEHLNDLTMPPTLPLASLSSTYAVNPRLMAGAAIFHLVNAPDAVDIGCLRNWKNVTVLPSEKANAEVLKQKSVKVGTSRAPNSVQDFENLVAFSPNSSLAWIRYMVFLLRVRNVKQAREVAWCALQKIKNGLETLNIWLAMLNLELRYGTEESMGELLGKVVGKKSLLMFRKAVEIYQHFGNSNKTVELYDKMVERFKEDTAVWVMYATFLMKRKQHSKAGAVLDRALVELPKLTGLSFESDFAKLEMKYGKLKSGKARFEKLLMAFPKRLDVLYAYVDALTEQRDFMGARAVLQRATRQVKNTKRLTAIFNTLVEFERQHANLE